MRLPPYPTYKPSGVEWLGEVPDHWQALPLKRRHRIVNGGTPASSEESFWDGDVNWITPEDLGRNDAKRIGSSRRTLSREGLANCGAQLVPRDSIVISTRAPIGHVAVIEKESCTNQGCRALIPDAARAYAGYVYYTLIASRPVLQAAGKGTTFLELSAGLLGLHALALPPSEEQRAIADFLDRETAKIDTLVAKKRTLIERLKERRTALISRTVTRGLPPDAARTAGLDPHPKLKPSGIDWLGDVPEHWDVVPYKRVCLRVDVGIAEAATHAYCVDGVPIVRSTNVRPNRLDTSDVLRIEPWFAEKNRSKTLRAGDLVTVRTGYPGTTAVIPQELDGSQCFTLVLSSPKEDAHGPFFSWVLNSRAGASYFEMEGWGTAQTNISVPIVQMMPVPRPSHQEQVAIAAFLDVETARLDALSGKMEATVERLQEYRTALITAAVTGKIDVRNSNE